MEHEAPMYEFLGLNFNLANVLMITVASLDCVYYCNRFYSTNCHETNRHAEFYGVGHGFCQGSHQ